MVFSPGNGNAITLANPGISATTPVQMTLSVGGTGTLSLAGTSNLTIVSGANGSSSLTISGNIAALNAALDGLTYTPGSGDVGRTELDLTVSVPGDSALGTTAARVPLLDELAAPPAVINVPSGQFSTRSPPSSSRRAIKTPSRSTIPAWVTSRCSSRSASRTAP